MATTFELKTRTARDYDGRPLDRARHSDEQLIAAVTSAYPSLLQATATALSTGRSVLVRGPAYLAQPFAQALRDPLGRRDPEALHFSTLVDARGAGGVFYGQSDENVVEFPARTVLTQSFQRFLGQPQADDTIGVVDFLDSFFGAAAGEQADLLYLLHAYPERRLLGFALPETPLPPAIRVRFPVQLALPRLTREQVWALLSYREVQNLLGAQELSVAHQVVLHQALSGLDAVSARQVLIQLSEQRKVPTSPFQALAALKERLAPGTIPAAGLPDPADSTEASARLRSAVCEPWARYEAVRSATEVATLDRERPRGVLLTGEVAHAESLALWLAGQLRARFVLAPPTLTTSPATLAGSLPAVIFTHDLDATLSWGPGPVHDALAAWRAARPEEPVFFAAHVHDARALPAPVRQWFALEVSV